MQLSILSLKFLLKAQMSLLKNKCVGSQDPVALQPPGRGDRTAVHTCMCRGKEGHLHVWEAHAVIPSLLTQGGMALFSEISAGKGFQRITRPFSPLLLFIPIPAYPLRKCDPNYIL